MVLHEGGIWQCVIKNANLFLNIESKEQMEVNREWYLRVNKVELIPHEWKVAEGNLLHLKGQ